MSSVNDRMSRVPAVRRRGVVALLAACVSLLACLLAPAGSLAAECENEAIRKEQGSTFLPECRAYELVSPPEADVEVVLARGEVPTVPEVVASEHGKRASYYSFGVNAGDRSSGYFFLSTRDGEGWSTVNAVPPQLPGAEEPGCKPLVYFSPSLTSDLLTDGGLLYGNEGLSSFCAANDPGLASDEPQGGFTNIFRHDWATGAYETVNLTPAGAAPENAFLEDMNADQSHVVFAESAELVSGAPNGFDLYESAGGHVRLLTYLPEGEPALGRLVDGNTPEFYEGHVGGPGTGDISSAAPLTHAESENGERVFFTAGGNLYLRLRASHAPTASGRCSGAEPEGACTVQLDAKQGGVEEGGGTFLYASADGSRAFFMDDRRLTSDATAKPSEPDLYEYDVEAPEGARLKDLTVSTGKPADVQGFTGASEDGSYLYFVADGALAGGAVQGRPNLYLDHEGALSLVATLNPEYDQEDWASSTYGLRFLTATTSPSGRYLAFDSVESERLAKYDNRPAKERECPGRGFAPRTTAPCTEVFRYAAAEKALVCASCDPSGKQPIGPAEVKRDGRTGFAGTSAVYRSRQLLDDGRLFFTTLDPLVASDTNGNYDVYEYSEGAPHLISSGTAEGAAAFAGASVNGEDVFFVTPQSLLAADSGGTPSLYDARVEGGFQAQSVQPVAPEECVAAQACRQPLAEPPVEAFGASSAFNGAGDLVPAEATLQEPRSGKQKKHGKPRLTRRQKLKRALKACARLHRKRARKKCRRRARRRFNPHGKHERHHRHVRERARKHTHRRHSKGRGRR